MEVWQAIKGRRAVRQYESEPLDRGVLQRLIDAAAMAPSVMNSQPWHFHIVQGQQRDEVVKILNRSTLMLADVFAEMEDEEVEMATKFFSDCGGAPVVVVVSIPRRDGDEYQHIVDLLSCGCSLQNLQLAAYAEGLSTCVLTISFWVRDDIEKFLKVDDREVVCCVLVGKSASEPKAPPRRPNIVDWLGG